MLQKNHHSLLAVLHSLLPSPPFRSPLPLFTSHFPLSNPNFSFYPLPVCEKLSRAARHDRISIWIWTPQSTVHIHILVRQVGHRDIRRLYSTFVRYSTLLISDKLSSRQRQCDNILKKTRQRSKRQVLNVVGLPLKLFRAPSSLQRYLFAVKYVGFQPLDRCHSSLARCQRSTVYCIFLDHLHVQYLYVKLTCCGCSSDTRT